MLSLQTSRSFGMVSRHAPMLSFPGRNTSCVVTSLGLISRPFDFRASRNGSNPKTLTHIQIHHSGFIKMPQFLGRFSVSRFHVATMKIVWSMWKTAPKKSIYSRRNQWISSDIPVSTSCSDHHHPVTAWADFSIRPTLVHMPTKLRESHQRKVEMIPLWILSTSKTPDLEHWKILKWYGNDTFKNCQLKNSGRKTSTKERKKEKKKQTNKILA